MALFMVALSSLRVARFSHGVGAAAAAAPRSTKAMLVIIVVSSNRELRILR